MYSNYDHRLYEKTWCVLDKYYSAHIFEAVETIPAVEGYITKEHFRSAPEGVEWHPVIKGQHWGGEYVNLWTRCTFVVPASLEGQTLYVMPETGAQEGLVFVNGKPCGMLNANRTGGNAHFAIHLCDNAKAGDSYLIEIDNYAWHYVPGHKPYDNYGKDYAVETDCICTFSHIAVGIKNPEIMFMFIGLKNLLQLTKELPDTNTMKFQALDTLEEIRTHLCYDPLHRSKEEVQEGVFETNRILHRFFTSQAPVDNLGAIGIIGHSHMDTAWLWPVSETIRKCARTYANAISLMNQYPEYKFVQSSALHCDWMREYYPSIFKDMQAKVAKGQYEVNGGVWVECDCNITSGEFMIRQFLKGQQFYRRYFNKTTDCFWLPDTFGYSAAIPQIMRGSEVKYFYTTKISWNDLNTFPYDTFIWEGIDGTRVQTHFNTTHSDPDARQVVHATRSMHNRRDCPDRLVAFGFGDGGGGPNAYEIEDARLMTQLGNQTKVTYSTVSDFMKHVEDCYPSLPLYRGELYLELHRGTLTQAHDNKRNNRKSELALRDFEYLNVLADKPMDEDNDQMVKVILKNQFHDILPGSSLEIVNKTSRQEFAELGKQLAEKKQKYLSYLTTANKKQLCALNTLSFDRTDPIAFEGVSGAVAGYPSQTYTNLKGKQVLLVGGVEVPAFGAINLTLSDKAIPATSPFVWENNTLETPAFTVEFLDDGRIASLMDKNTGREVRNPKGAPLNTFYTYDNVPLVWDNWDIDPDDLFTAKEDTCLQKREIVSDGPVAFIIRQTYLVGRNSTLTQDIIFWADNERIDFYTVVDWKEHHVLLKVGFDVDVMADRATHEIQYGYIERATTSNNSLEAAQFEVCNHKWSDLSDKRFGVAILNDCKYGISVDGGDMRLSLLRSGTRPDPTGDNGVHEMTYSLLPHEGICNAESVIQPAYCLNIPYIVSNATVEKTDSFMEIGAQNVICEALKPAEETENAIVARLYECERARTQTAVKLPLGYTKLYLTNMLEDIKEEIPLVDGWAELEFSPFEIKTLMMVK